MFSVLNLKTHPIGAFVFIPSILVKDISQTLIILPIQTQTFVIPNIFPIQTQAFIIPNV